MSRIDPGVRRSTTWKMKRGDALRSSSGSEGRPSRATATRLSLYLRCAESAQREGAGKVSSSQLGQALGVSDTQVRKDLAYLGSIGHPGIGYATQELIDALRRTLGIDRTWSAALVGVGNLARALLRYRGFQQQGFRIVALFDVDPAKIGLDLDGLEVHPLSRMPEILAGCKAELGIITVPAEAAQSVTDALVDAGVRGILNFAPVLVRLPPGISLVSVDLTVQLEQLAFQVQTRMTD